jgi:hypothetical protein
MSENKKDSEYLSMDDEIFDLKHGDAKDKSVAALKMFGKGLFNTSKFLVTKAIPEITKAAAQQNISRSNELLKDSSIDSDRRQKLEDFNQKSKDALANANERLKKNK